MLDSHSDFVMNPIEKRCLIFKLELTTNSNSKDGSRLCRESISGVKAEGPGAWLLRCHCNVVGVGEWMMWVWGKYTPGGKYGGREGRKGTKGKINK